MPSPVRKAEKPLICFLRLYGTAKKRMVAVCKKYSTDHNSVAMSGALKEVLRLETHAAELDEKVATALAELERLGVDPLPHLKAILADVAGNAEVQR